MLNSPDIAPLDVKEITKEPLRPAIAERRSAERAANREVFNIANSAKEIIKHEDPEGFAGRKAHMQVIQRVTREMVSLKQMTEEQRDETLAEIAAAMSAPDDYDRTGAFNDPSIKRYVRKTLEAPTEEGKEDVFVALDINSLGRMNRESRKGHLSADRALEEFVRFHIGELSRKFGYTARLGRLSKAGDEFVIIIPNTTQDEVNEFFQEIEGRRLEAMKKIVEEEGLPTDIQAGRVIVGLRPGDTFDSAYARSDEILMKEKREKREQQTEISVAETNT